MTALDNDAVLDGLNRVIKEAKYLLAYGGAPEAASRLLRDALYGWVTPPSLQAESPSCAWCLTDNDDQWHGGHETPKEAIEATRDETDADVITVGLCYTRRQALSFWLPDMDQLLEQADEALADSDETAHEDDQGPWFEVTSEQRNSLERMLTATVDAWQAMHGLVFTTRTFSKITDERQVVLRDPDAGETPDGEA